MQVENVISIFFYRQQRYKIELGKTKAHATNPRLQLNGIEAPTCIVVL